MKYEIIKIDGIETILASMDDAYSTTIEILVKAGSIYENKENNGISHFLEHMFFKGGKRYKDSYEVSEIIDEIGGEFNAFTSDEHAGYYVKCAPDFIDRGIDVLSDMLINARFPEDEMEKEKSVIVQEIKMYEDMPNRHVVDLWKEYYYGDNSFGWNTAGTIDNVNSFTQKQLIDYKNSQYTKDNLIIIIAGKINDKERIKELIKTGFSKLKDKRATELPTLQIVQPKKKLVSKKLKTKQNHLVIGCKGFDSFDDRRFAANLLGIIIGGNMSSRLVQEIREKKGLCYYIGCNHMSNTQDGMFMIRAGIEKDRFDEGLEAIYTELEKIAGGDISKKEFDKALGYIKGKIQMGIETSDQLADFLGEQYLLEGEIMGLDEMLKSYEALTIKDLKDIANMISKDNLYAYYVH